MITDLVQIKLLGEKKADENRRLRSYMKAHNHHDNSDRILRRIAQGVEDEMDCTTCANCCRVATTRVSDRDVDRLSRHLRVKPDQFLRDYTALDPEDGTRILKWTEGAGCVFLDGNLCSVYEARPDICQRYPHLVRGTGSLSARMWDMVDRASVCPIVYNSLEAWKDHLRFRR
jgi:Fe-S-cluster containining protein